MTDSYEEMIGAALLGDDAEKEKQLRRVDCKLWASNKIFCECGAVHDQRKIQILKNAEDKIVGVCCHNCRKKAEDALKAKDLTALIGWTWNNWDWSTTIVHVEE